MTNSETPKFNVTPAQVRQLQIHLADLYGTKSAYENVDDWFAEIGRYSAMQAGLIEFKILGEYKVLPKSVKEKVGEKLYVAYFFAPSPRMRDAKMCLLKSLDLLHMPHGMQTEVVGVSKFRVVGITRETAFAVLENNRQLFLKVEFLETAEKVEKVSVEEITDPELKRKIRDAARAAKAQVIAEAKIAANAAESAPDSPSLEADLSITE
jgi:hypothetical protein